MEGVVVIGQIRFLGDVGCLEIRCGEQICYSFYKIVGSFGLVFVVMDIRRSKFGFCLWKFSVRVGVEERRRGEVDRVRFGVQRKLWVRVFFLVVCLFCLEVEDLESSGDVLWMERFLRTFRLFRVKVCYFVFFKSLFVFLMLSKS